MGIGRAGRGLLLGVVAAAACLAGARGWGQDSGADLLEPLRHGRVVIWVVNPAKKVDSRLTQFKSPTPGYTESTTGNLGQTSSSYGQTSGSYGVSSSSDTIAVPTQEQRAAAAANGALPGYHEQTAGSFGTDSSNFGKEASNHGSDVSSVGQTAGSFGTAASNHGQSVGSFGTAASNFGAGMTPAAVSAQRAKLKAVEYSIGRGGAWGWLFGNLRHDFPEAQVFVAQVDADALRFDLKLVSGSEDYPDVLMGSFPEEWKQGMQREFGVVGLQPAEFAEDGTLTEAPKKNVPAFSISLKALHPDAARAFAVWMDEGASPCFQCGPKKNPAFAMVRKLAASAIQRLIQGQGLGEDADPEMVQLAPGSAASVLMTTDGSLLDPLGVQVKAADTVVNHALAAVSVRVLAAGNAVFGLAHPLVVMRLGADGKWKVLQVSLNLPVEEQREQLTGFLNTSPGPGEREVGLSVATPKDGERVRVRPELWWDNAGGAGLEVVEWQRGPATAPSRLFLVHDSDGILKTRVVAGFAADVGPYRWRVWSVGAGGATRISEWRTMVVGP